MITTDAPRDAVEVIVGFARRLGQDGLAVPPTRVHAMLEALGELGAESLGAVYWAGRVTLCASPEDIECYDRTFAAYFSGRPPPAVRRTAVTPIYRPGAVPADPAAPGQGDDVDSPPQRLATASRIEVLRHRDLAGLTADEKAEVHRFISALTPAVADRVSRRMHTAPSGRVDPHRTVRAILRHGGEPVDLRRQRPLRRYRRVVFLVDVSGSMAPYADTMLRFAHAACRTRPGTEVFTVGTRLTRVTRQLQGRDPSAALSAAMAAVTDWSGGTRLGDELAAFLDQWGQRGTARGAVVVIGSDGWERGDPTLLGEQMARLARLARAVVWVNPHRGREGFVPSTGGMRAALPHLDHLVAGHSLAAYEELAGLLGGTGQARERHGGRHA